MKFETVLKLIVSLALLIVVATATKCVMDVRSFAINTQLAIEPDMSQLEVDYRTCLKREAGMVGVASLKQMQKCAEETGYGK